MQKVNCIYALRYIYLYSISAFASMDYSYPENFICYFAQELTW